MCFNKKVLLCECKRHTARRVVRTPSVVLTGYPPGWGYPTQGVTLPRGLPYPGGTLPGGYPSRGVPCQRVPSGGTLPGGVPCLWGTLPRGYPPWVGMGYPGHGTPPSGPGRVPPHLSHGILGNVAKHYGMGTPPAGPGQVAPHLSHGILGNVAKHYGRWVPPPPCGQTDVWMDGWMDRHVSKHYLPVILRTRAVTTVSPEVTITEILIIYPQVSFWDWVLNINWIT